MNVFEIDIWCRVQHNGEFSHTVTRIELIHALNEERARQKITLKKGGTRNSNGLTVDWSDEFIYMVRKAGTVTKQLYYEYSDGRHPRRVSHPHQSGGVEG